MSSHVRQHKSPYFYVHKGAGFVLLENHVETGTRYKTEAEAKRAVLALNDAWREKHGTRARHTKSNPRRRNPAAEAEMILWARPAGKTDALYEQPIYTQRHTMEDIERVKKLAAKDGWHTFRVQKLDLSKPFNARAAFAGGVRRKNPAKKLHEGSMGVSSGQPYPVKDIRKGELVKRKPGAKKFYQVEGYDRSERKYVLQDWDDISRTIYVKGDTLVYLGD
jgi:hypothetical protein